MLPTLKKIHELKHTRLISNSSDSKIIYNDPSLIVIKKPHFIHSAPITKNQTKKDITLVDLVTTKFPDVLNIKGRKEGEYGLIHRLDYLTSGLVIFARNQNSFNKLLNEKITKYYLVKSFIPDNNGYKYPQSHTKESWDNVLMYLKGDLLKMNKSKLKFHVQSKFRSYGPKGQEVRVVTDDVCQRNKIKYTKDEYLTEGMVIDKNNESILCCVKIQRGFRHQIRAHMSYIGLPIINDPLYGSFNNQKSKEMGLHSIALSFRHPETNEVVNIFDDDYKDLIKRCFEDREI